MTQPPIGTIGVTPTYGSWYDRVIGSLIRWGTGTKDQYGKWHSAKVNHAFIYLGDGKIMEARPGGAGVNNWDAYDGTIWLTNLVTLPAAAVAATKLVGTPYGFLDIVAIARAQKRVDHDINPAQPPWWVKRLASRQTLICSQLCDVADLSAGIHLFVDGRLPGLVSPADLLRLNG